MRGQHRTEEMRPALIFHNSINNAGFANVDEWYPEKDDIIFKVHKGAFVAPLKEILNISELDDNFNAFVLSTKKCYNSTDMRNHLYQYLNYFEKFYDTDREYLVVLYQLKILCERFKAYTVDNLKTDLRRYILYSGIHEKVVKFVDDNYKLHLNYVNKKNPSLQYTDRHAKLLLRMSLLADLEIPILTDYAYMHKIDNIDDYLLSAFDDVLHRYPEDIYSKLYDTAYTNTIQNEKNNQLVWNKQSIRAIDVTTHSMNSVANIILNIMPKYTYDRNVVSFNK